MCHDCFNENGKLRAREKDGFRMLAWLDTNIDDLNFQKQPTNQISQKRRKEEWRSSSHSKLLLAPGGAVHAQCFSVSCSPLLLLV